MGALNVSLNKDKITRTGLEMEYSQTYQYDVVKTNSQGVGNSYSISITSSKVLAIYQHDNC